jgi:hypothetical protein
MARDNQGVRNDSQTQEGHRAIRQASMLCKRLAKTGVLMCSTPNPLDPSQSPPVCVEIQAKKDIWEYNTRKNRT